VEADAATARRGVAAADAGDQHAETLLVLIETGAEAATADADLIHAVLAAGYAYLPLATRATYDELISTGHLRLIRDAGLKRDLSRYYERMESARQWDDLVRPYRDDLVVAVECMFTWYWLADLCQHSTGSAERRWHFARGELRG
jgi:hypothetical protein